MLNNIQYNNNVLFTFDMLIDLDIGLLKVISKKYNDERYFHRGILNNMTLDEQKYILVTRKEYNPLSVLSKIENKEERYSLYETLINKEYDEILKNSICTDVIDLFIKYVYSNGIILPCILCKNEKEEEIIKTKLDDISTTEYGIEVCEDIRTLDTTIFDSIYLKSYVDILQFNNINGKNIIISSCNYNMINLNGELVPIPEISMEISETNELSIINLYKLNQEAIGEG